MVGNPIAEATRCRAESDDLCGYTHGPTADRRPNLPMTVSCNMAWSEKQSPAGHAALWIAVIHF
jgi:hypothetical protein